MKITYRSKEYETHKTPVPSYEEWQSMDRLEKIMLQERARLNKQVIELLEENTKIKELLKGAKEIIEWYKDDCGYKDVPTEVTLQHINNVLGEEQ